VETVFERGWSTLEKGENAAGGFFQQAQSEKYGLGCEEHKGQAWRKREWGKVRV